MSLSTAITNQISYQQFISTNYLKTKKWAYFFLDIWSEYKFITTYKFHISWPWIQRTCNPHSEVVWECPSVQIGCSWQTAELSQQLHENPWVSCARRNFCRGSSFPQDPLWWCCWSSCESVLSEQVKIQSLEMEYPCPHAHIPIHLYFQHHH